MGIEYITTRELENNKGQTTGKIRIIKLKGENGASVKLKCPECGFEESRKETWSEPFVNGAGKKQSFSIKCKKCDYSTKLLKLKKQLKKK